jgi:hypothetical protein
MVLIYAADEYSRYVSPSSEAFSAYVSRRTKKTLEIAVTGKEPEEFWNGPNFYVFAFSPWNASRIFIWLSLSESAAVYFSVNQLGEIFDAVCSRNTVQIAFLNSCRNNDTIRQCIILSVADFKIATCYSCKCVCVCVCVCVYIYIYIYTGWAKIRCTVILYYILYTHFWPTIYMYVCVCVCTLTHTVLKYTVLYAEIQ